MPRDKQQDIKLQYMSGVQSALFETGRKGHVVFLIHAAISIIVMLLSTGVVSVESRLSLGGVTLSAPIPLLVLGAACLVAMAQYYDACLLAYQERLRQELLRQYQSLGFVPERAALEGNWSAFVYPDIGTVFGHAWEKSVATPFVLNPLMSALPAVVRTKKTPRNLDLRLLLYLAASGVVVLGLALLPIGAEVLAVRGAILYRGMNWLIGLVIVVLVLLNVAASLVASQPVRDSVRRAVEEARGLVLPAMEAVQREAEAQAQARQTGRDTGATPAGDEASHDSRSDGDDDGS